MHSSLRRKFEEREKKVKGVESNKFIESHCHVRLGSTSY